ncbi:ornithine cyclodeaminase family protein [Nioella nitratireducens]|uniref:ornithine cyclodeaminase family protein n=1 Tax=Nioella nitratireducens TaxID=1287720 RepID=UPI0008FCF956|nr:ornithine cyclodeaminase [Nioella nitratireducens]
MTFEIIGKEAEAQLNWLDLIESFRAGHRLPKAEIGDTFLYRGKDTLLSRAAWIDGMGSLVKTANVFPGNPDKGVAMIQGAVNLYDDGDGSLAALVDFHLVTKWKTAGDSLLGAAQLARKDSDVILIVGAGTVGHSLRQAYGALFPDARFLVWNRTVAKAEAFAADYPNTSAAPDLAEAVGQADIVTSATMSTEPLLKGEWLRPGQHIDVIGAYRPDMREVDDEVLRRASVHVDSRATTIGHIGEIQIPLDRGVITEADIVSDFYDLAAGKMTRQDDAEITFFKNGGGAHLDLMTSRYILSAWQGR